MSFGRVGLKRYIIPITFDNFKLIWSMCLLHLGSEDFSSTRKLNSAELLWKEISRIHQVDVMSLQLMNYDV